MDDHFTLTIHDDKGVKQFNVHNLLKRFMWYGVSLVAIIVFVGMGASLYLYDNVKNTQNSYMELEKKNHALQANILEVEKKLEAKKVKLESKQQEYTELSNSLKEIETFIGITPESNCTIEERVNITKLSSEHMATLLQFIPSGMPLIYSGITSSYGERTHPITHKKEFHRGIDFRAKMRTPVYATADAIVEWAGYHEKSGYGNLVILRHAYGFKSLYGHLNKVVVKYKEYVKKGDLIGYSGNSGMSSGPHLHYELQHLYKTLNPYYFTKWSIENYQQIFEKEKSILWNSILEVTRHISVLKPTKVVPLSYKEEKALQKKKKKK